MMPLTFSDPAQALGWSWNAYVLGLHVTLFLAGAAVAAAIARPFGARARAAVYAWALVGVLLVTAMGYLPSGWWAHAIPSLVAGPLVTLGALNASTWHDPTAPVAWATLLPRLWLAGVALLVLRLAVGWLAMHLVTRRAERVTDAQWSAALRDAAATLGTGQVVELRRSARVGAPLTWGVLDPVIVLPAHSDAWPREHRRAVLLHELAHVRRGDGPLQLLAELAVAVWWVHPGVWWARRGLRRAREEASDLVAIEAGVPPSTYAACLMSVGEQAASGPGVPVVALPMARTPELAMRVRHLLAPALRRRRVPGRLSAPAAMLAIAWVLALGFVRLSPERGVLWRALDSADWRERAYAAAVLGHSRDPVIRDELRARTIADPHPAVQRIVATSELRRAPRWR